MLKVLFKGRRGKCKKFKFIMINKQKEIRNNFEVIKINY